MMTDRNLVPQLPPNSEELWESLPFLSSEKKLEINYIKILVFMVIQIGGLTSVLRCFAVLTNSTDNNKGSLHIDVPLQLC